jgi:aminoglycoside 2''-phosphotransferase
MEEYKKLIKKYFPKLQIEYEKFITSGWESDILIINNEKVFRFPKKNNRFDIVYNKEKIITDLIRPFVSIPITKMEIYKKGFLKKEIIFSLLDYIEGDTLEIKNDIDISDDLTSFLYSLHSININIFKSFDKLNANNLPFYKYKLKLTNFTFNNDILNKFLNSFKLQNDFNNCIRIFSDFEWKDEENVLCHNDLHMGNIMINNNKISGIIDFGDCIYTNYNIEFISILKWKNNSFIKQIIKKYENLTSRTVNLNFIIAVLKLQTYSKFGVNNNENKCLERLKQFNDILCD